MLKVAYKKATPGIVERHFAAFITQTGQIILHGPFLNSNHAKKIAGDIMNKKKKSRSFFILPVVGVMDTEALNENLVDMAKNNQLVNCIIIENASDSYDENEKFAMNYFKNAST